jgi:hypothetical protein
VCMAEWWRSLWIHCTRRCCMVSCGGRRWIWEEHPPWWRRPPICSGGWRGGRDGWARLHGSCCLRRSHASRGGPGSSAPPRPAVAGCTSPGSSSPSVRRAREGSGQRAGEGMKAAWSAGEGSSQPRRQCSGGGAPAMQQPCPIRAAGSAGKSGNCPPEPAGDGSGGGSSGSGRTAVLRRKSWSTVRSRHSLPMSCARAT